MNLNVSCHALAGLRVGSCIYAELSGMQPDLLRWPARPRMKLPAHEGIDGKKQRHTSIGPADCSKSALNNVCTNVTSKAGTCMAYTVENVPFCRGSRYGLIVGRVSILSFTFLGLPVCAVRCCTSNYVAEGIFPKSP
jgi:hypothetical protein